MKRIHKHVRTFFRVFKFWAGATRASFASASMVPVVLGGSVAAAHGAFAVGPFLLSAVGVLVLHLAANLVNDYYDYTSGADVIRDSRTPLYGGGTILVDGTLIPRQVSRAYRFLYAVALLAGIALAAMRGTGGAGVLAFGLAGSLCGYFYTAPPLHLSYVGLGEATIGLCFGPLTVAGVYFVQTGRLGAEAVEALVASLPVGLLVAAIVFVNEFPDRASDGAAGKRTVVVRLPLRAALACYAALVLAPFAVIAGAIRFGLLPHGAALAFLGLPLAMLGIRNLGAAYATSGTRRAGAGASSPGDHESSTACTAYVTSRQVVASISTILLHLAVGLLLSLAFVLQLSS
ncbi:MAG: prenyltransferase [Bacillota bacterium]